MVMPGLLLQKTSLNSKSKENSDCRSGKMGN